MTADLARQAALHRIAERLHGSALVRYPQAAALPPLVLMTDPARVPDPVAAAGRLPPGSGVVYRAFGASGAEETARALAEVARRKGLVLLVGLDWRLARRVGARGVHLPERLAHRARAVRSAWPSALITAAAHSRSGLARAARYGADAAFLSLVFPSASPSAAESLGPLRFAAMARAAALPVYALGGVDEKNAPALVRSGAVGLAAVGALA
ncbi:MAG TPA: thiamine phosphate synthase [Caulobacteraceae bacterium]|jgi:thiamine-phosphate pyrophosphorylase